MNDNDLKILFKNGEEQVNPDFTDSLMKSINVHKAPSKVFSFSKLRILNIFIPTITIISVIVYYFISPATPESEFSKYILSVWNNLSSHFISKVDIADFNNLILLTTFVIVISTLWDKLFSILFKIKSRLH